MKIQISILFLAMVLISFPCVVTANVSDGLAAYYPLDGNAIDASGNGNDGQVLEPIPCEDFFGNTSGAMYFNGDSAHTINIGNRVKPPFPFTISAWINPDTVDGANLVIRADKWDTTADGQIFADYGNGGWPGHYSRRNFASDPVMVAGAWQHVAMVFRCYRDILFI